MSSDTGPRGGSRRATMDSCFACHGLVHGPTGKLASAECVDCHPSPSCSARLARQGLGRRAAREGLGRRVNRCMMCHDAPVDCDACHATEAPDVGPMPVVYLSTCPSRRQNRRDDRSRRAGGDGQCVYCHRTSTISRWTASSSPREPPGARVPVRDVPPGLPA